MEEVKLLLLKIKNLEKILALKVQEEVHLLRESNNQLRKEGLLSYHLKRHKERHIKKERQEKEVKKLKLLMNYYQLKRRKK